MESGLRGSDEKRFKLVASVERICRGVDDGLTSSTISLDIFGGDRESERLKNPRPDSPDNPVSSDAGVITVGMSSGNSLTQLSSLVKSGGLSASEASLARRGSTTVGGGTSLDFTRRMVSMA